MTRTDAASIQKSKRAFRRQLEERSIAEKLRLLDALRERTIAIKNAAKDYRKTSRELA